jgi:hypothetical protein
MTTTTTTKQSTLNNSLKFAVENGSFNLAKWAFEQSEKPTNIGECLLKAISMAEISKEMLELLTSQLLDKPSSNVQISNVEETKVEETIFPYVRVVGVKETKVEETKVEVTKVEETKVEETKVEETKVEETKVEETKVEETNVEETKVEETKIEETKVELPKIGYVGKIPVVILNKDIYFENFELIGKISRLTYRIIYYPKLVLEELMIGAYSLEELNYQSVDNKNWTILHILCKMNTKDKIYEEILEYFLTKTDIDINLISTNNKNAFQLAMMNFNLNNLSNRLIKIFLDHPKFNHSIKINKKNIVTYLFNRIGSYDRIDLIKLLIENPKTIIPPIKDDDNKHMLISIAKRAIKNKEYMEIFEIILANSNIELPSLSDIFSNLNVSLSSMFLNFWTIIAKSKRIKLELFDDDDYTLNDYLMKFSSDQKTVLLKIYIEHFPEGIVW